MGILSIMNRNLLSQFKSNLKTLSSSSSYSSDPCYIRRFLCAATAQTHTGDLPPNNRKLGFLIERIEEESPKYSLLFSADDDNSSWKDRHHPIPNPFSGTTIATTSEQLLHGSCNELTFFYNNDLNFEGESRQRRVSLWNPTTTRIHTLPLSRLPRPHPVSYMDINCSGLGFEPKSQDYKFISFLRYYYENGFGFDSADEDHIELYSLKADSWKRIDASPYGTFPLQAPAVHVNGVYYWTVLGGCEEDGEYSILSFDFADEEFSLFRLPQAAESLPENVDGFALVEFYGSLGTLVHTDPVEQADEPFGFEVLVWDGKTWISGLPRVTIEDDVIVAAGGHKLHRVLGLFQNNYLLLQNAIGELLLFDVKARKLENLGIQGALEYESLNVFPFFVPT